MSQLNSQSEKNGCRPNQEKTTEVVPQAKRRAYSTQYKLRILQEADECSEAGQIGALLRREGLYSSHLSTWRHQREEGELGGPGRKRERKAEQQATENVRLRQENERLRHRLAQMDLIVNAQKKFVSVFESLTQPSEGSS